MLLSTHSTPCPSPLVLGISPHKAALAKGALVSFAGSTPKSSAENHMEALENLAIPYKFDLFLREVNKPLTDNQALYKEEALLPEDLVEVAQSAKLIAVGDLHGSYEKLLEVLLSSGLATLPPKAAEQFNTANRALKLLSKKDKHLPIAFREYVKGILKGLSDTQIVEKLGKVAPVESGEDIANAAAYLRNKKDEYRLFYLDLKNALQHLKWTGKPGQQLLLIGDVLADRGPLDLVTLSIIEKLREEDPQRIIGLASNHDHAAMTLLLKHQQMMQAGFMESFLRSLLLMEVEQITSHTGAGEGMQTSVYGSTPPSFSSLPESKLEHFKARCKNYLAQSRLLHYEPRTRALFTHAPITHEHLERLNDILPPPESGKPDPFEDAIKQKDVHLFCAWVDSINNKWKELVERAFRNRHICILINNLMMPLDPSNRLDEQASFVWTRNKLDTKDQLPLQESGLVTSLIHGHDPGSKRSPYHAFPLGEMSVQGELGAPYYLFNLDQENRKSSDAMHQPDSSLYLQIE